MLTKNVKISLLLLLVAFLYVFVFGCDDVTVNTSGTMDTWSATGIDTAIEDAAAPILDLGDAAVEALRDAETEAIKWGVK